MNKKYLFTIMGLFISSLGVVAWQYQVIRKLQNSIKESQSQLTQTKLSYTNFLDPNAKCPYVTNTKINLSFNNEVSVVYPPKSLDKKEIILPAQKFNPNDSTFDGEDIYALDGKKQMKTTNFDIDGDDQMEQIISINTAMNHTPHVALIVKNGNVIFKDSGAQTYIFDQLSVYPSKGSFSVHKTIDWSTGEEQITHYKIINDKIFPVWVQKVCNVRNPDS